MDGITLLLDKIFNLKQFNCQQVVNVFVKVLMLCDNLFCGSYTKLCVTDLLDDRYAHLILNVPPCTFIFLFLTFLSEVDLLLLSMLLHTLHTHTLSLSLSLSLSFILFHTLFPALTHTIHTHTHTLFRSQKEPTPTIFTHAHLLSNYCLLCPLYTGWWYLSLSLSLPFSPLLVHSNVMHLQKESKLLLPCL